MSWKAVEREIARRLGGARLPRTGYPTPDVLAGAFAVEGKARRTLPGWFRDAMRQAVANAGDRIPVVVWHESGNRYVNDIVCLRFADFVALLQEQDEQEERHEDNEEQARPAETRE